MGAMIKAGFSLLIFFNIVSLCTYSWMQMIKMHSKLHSITPNLNSKMFSAMSTPETFELKNLTDLDDDLEQLMETIDRTDLTAEPEFQRQLQDLRDLAALTLTPFPTTQREQGFAFRPLNIQIKSA